MYTQQYFSYCISLCLALLGVLLGLSLPLHTASAQLIPTPESQSSLVLDPSFPNPDSIVSVRLDAYSINTVGAEILWFIDGVESVTDRNNRSITVTAPALGSEMMVKATVRLQSGTSFSLTRVLRPSSIDLIIESDTHTPLFYMGRALPSTEAAIRLIALTHTGKGVATKDLTYEWQYNGNALFGGPIRGKNIAELTMPRYKGDYVTVRVISGTGEVLGERSILLEATEPELHFYEENPLRGQSPRALTSPFRLMSDETTLFAEPYYLNTSLQTDDVSFEWRINGVKTQTVNADQHTITLRPEGGGGRANIEVKTVTKRVIPQYLTGNFIVDF